MKISNILFITNITIAAGISALLQLILLGLMFTVSRKLFGTISDYFYALTPLLILPFVISLPRFFGPQDAGISQLARVLGIIGILIASSAQVILLLKIIDFKPSIWGNLIGIGLIGFPVLVMTLIYPNNSVFPSAFKVFGIVLGFAMVIGIPAGFLYLDELFAVQNGTLVWSTTHPQVYVAILAGIITQIGLPVWLIWAARLMASGQLIFVR